MGTATQSTVSASITAPLGINAKVLPGAPAEWLTVRQIGDVLGVGKCRVGQLIRAGRIAGAKLFETPQGALWMAQRSALAGVMERTNGYPKGRKNPANTKAAVEKRKRSGGNGSKK